MLSTMLATTWSSARMASAVRAAPSLARQLSGAPAEAEAEARRRESAGRQWRAAALVGAGAALAGSALWLAHRRRALAAASTSAYGMHRAGLPTYSMDEVARHGDMKNGVWLTYHQGVYDITKFVKEHPGGSTIMMGAGGSADPFWDLYGVHQQEHVLKLLEKYRIGNVRSDEVGSHRSGMTHDPWADEPRRHPALKSSSKRPYNAEPPPALLADNFFTPNDLFYVRNHLPVPDVSAASYELEVDGVGLKPLSISLERLKRDFEPVTVTATIMCAGNRRSEMSAIKPVRGLSWGHAAVGNATWTGARLCDVLKAAGFKAEEGHGRHVCFEGLDTDPSNSPYGASIPLERATDPRRDVILAYQMNGAPLSRDHGFPVRVIVPGVVSARNVKWLGRITISEEESTSHWQRSDYKGFNPSVDWDTVDFSRSPSIQELPVNSAICWPANGDTAKVIDGAVTVKGYAWSGGGQRVVRVDVTTDGGTTWHEAHLDAGEAVPAGRCWSWCLWSAHVPVKAGANTAQIWVKATDASCNTQPENVANIWNLRGVLSNAYHRVNVQLKRR